MINHSPVENLPVIIHNSLPVITTELLAQVYGTYALNIQVNHTRNKDRFSEGKHYYKATGNELKDLRLTLSKSQNPVSAKTRSLILWTERGAARHAKMLDTDQAWEVFEKLEDFYFNQKQNTEFDRMEAELNRSRMPDTLGDLVGTATAQNLNQLVDRLQKIVIEGEFIPKGGRAVRYVIDPSRKSGKEMVRDFMACGEDSPIENLLTLLNHDGHDIKSVELEMNTLRTYIIGLTTAISDIQTHAQYINYAVGKIE